MYFRKNVQCMKTSAMPPMDITVKTKNRVEYRFCNCFAVKGEYNGWNGVAIESADSRVSGMLAFFSDRDYDSIVCHPHS